MLGPVEYQGHAGSNSIAYISILGWLQDCRLSVHARMDYFLNDSTIWGQSK